MTKHSEPTATTTEVPTGKKPAIKKRRAGKPKASKNGQKLAKAQQRILEALSRSKTGALSISDLPDKANVPATHISGFTFFATKAKKAKGIKALAEIGLVREIKDKEVGRLAVITSAGRKAAAK